MSALAERTDPFEVAADVRELTREQRIRERKARYRLANKEKIQEYRKRYRAENLEAIKVRYDAWRKANPEKAHEASNRWKHNNKEKANTVTHAWRKSDSGAAEFYRLTNSLSTIARKAFVNGIESKAASRLVGCSIAFLRNHIESLFLPGMSWGNHGDWHVDHIIPLSWFPLEDPEWRRVAFHWSNTQPLWGPENLSKGNRRAG